MSESSKPSGGNKKLGSDGTYPPSTKPAPVELRPEGNRRPQMKGATPEPRGPVSDNGPGDRRDRNLPKHSPTEVKSSSSADPGSSSPANDPTQSKPAVTSHSKTEGASAAPSRNPGAARASGKPGSAPKPGGVGASQLPSKGAVAGAAAEKLIKSKPGEEGTGKGAAKQALKDAASGAAEGAVTKGGVPGAVLGALKGLGGTFKNNKVFRNAVICFLAILIGALPALIGIGVIMLTTIGSAGASGGSEANKVASVQASQLEGNTVSGTQHALLSTGSSAPWTIALAASELIGNDEKTQKEKLKEISERDPVELDEADDTADEEKTEEAEADQDEVDAVKDAVDRASTYYDDHRTPEDKQTAKDSKTVYGWPMYTFSKILGWADPNGVYSDIAAGSVAATSGSDAARVITKPEDGGSPELWRRHEATKALYVNSMKDAGVSRSDAENVFDQALEWELGSIGCSTYSDTATTGTSSEKPADDQTSQNAKVIYSVLSSWGMPDENIAGILGNWDAESSIDPTSVQGDFSAPFKMTDKKRSTAQQTSNGIGLGQWTGGRNTKLREYAEKIGEDWFKVETQLGYMLSAGEGTDADIVRQMISEPKGSPEAAALFFHSKWERSADDASMAQRRATRATEWMGKISAWSPDTALADKILKQAGAEGTVTGAPTSTTKRCPDQTVESSEIGKCAPKCKGADGPQAGLRVSRALTLALSELGSARPTGYDMPGECIKSVQRWIAGGGGVFAPGGVVTGYQNSPAIRITDGSLRPGDVIQFESLSSPNAFIGGVHTYMVLKVNEDGTHDIVESNNPGGSGRVGKRVKQNFTPPPGFQAVVWRFAKTVDV